MVDVMLDIETLGTRPGAPVLQIGAVAFDRDNAVEEEAWLYGAFEATISLDSCLRMGLNKIEAATLQFWAQQDPILFHQLMDGDTLIFDAIRELVEWSEKLPDGTKWWANGQDFDFGILSHVFDVAQVDEPWRYNEPRDLRTLIDISGFEKNSIPKPKWLHNATTDCKHQIEIARGCFAKLKG